MLLVGRRTFLQFSGLAAAVPLRVAQAQREWKAAALSDQDWPSFRRYAGEHLDRIALPLGGIGTGTVSLCGYGGWRDWEVMNRPAKGFTPSAQDVEPFLAVRVATPAAAWLRALEGPLPVREFEGSHGSPSPNAHLPRFRRAEFATAYPFARVHLSDPDLPFSAELAAFNPLVPGDADASELPLVFLRVRVTSHLDEPARCSVVATLPNFIGQSQWITEVDWKGDPQVRGAKANRNEYRERSGLRGLFLYSEGVDPKAETWGNLALVTPDPHPLSHRIAWAEGGWGGPLLDFWDDFSLDGRLEPREPGSSDMPIASLLLEQELSPGKTREFHFLLTWYFPNRYSWDIEPGEESPEHWVGNHYCTRFSDAWEVAEKIAPQLPELQARTARFVNALLNSSYPDPIKEAALFNLSTLRSQTVFRTADGRLYGWEGCGDRKGCCFGTCTHVWNYEPATSFLFSDLALTQREVEFQYAVDEQGAMSFRVGLPLERAARSFGRVAADGQLGCLLKMYRDWQLSGRDDLLRRWWPQIRRALEFCWIDGGWDGDRDGVMEGVQHNTMDVEYLGPNPQMQFLYLGALRAVEEMARYLGETDFAAECRRLFASGSRWVDEHLFNGEYYEHEIRPLPPGQQVPEVFRVGMGAADLTNPDFQLGSGCLVDQLVGQYHAHLCDLGYLADPEKIRRALAAIWRYNRRTGFDEHFNPMRSFVLDGEAGLIMAAYPKDRPARPFPYFAEVMTGFEYTAAVGMLYEGMEDEGVECFRQTRARYDGSRRNPVDEAECGHHYARAMAAWAGLVAWSRFHYSAVEKRMRFTARPGRYFWSAGAAWGRCRVGDEVELEVLEGSLPLEAFELADGRRKEFPPGHRLQDVARFRPE